MPGTCYGPAGKASSSYQPCFEGTSDGHTFCCQNGWTCLPNMLCLDPAATGTMKTLDRGLCTDKTFNSPNCPQVCMADSRADGGVFVKNCGDGTGCCEKNGADCSCSVGSPGALLLELSAAIPYTARPTLPVTVLVSGIAVSVSSPPTASTSAKASTTTNIAVALAASQMVSSQPSSLSSSQNATRSSSVPIASPTISSTLSSLVATSESSMITDSTATPSLAIDTSIATAPSRHAPGKPLDNQFSGLGVKVGVPIGLIVVIAGLIFLFVFFRRRRERPVNPEHEAAMLHRNSSRDRLHTAPVAEPKPAAAISSDKIPYTHWKSNRSSRLMSSDKIAYTPWSGSELSADSVWNYKRGSVRERYELD